MVMVILLFFVSNIWAERYFYGWVVGLGHLVLRYLKVKKVDKML